MVTPVCIVYYSNRLDLLFLTDSSHTVCQWPLHGPSLSHAAMNNLAVTHTHTHTHTCIHTHTHIKQIHTHTHTSNKYTYTRTHRTNTHTHTHIEQIHTHTQTHTFPTQCVSIHIYVLVGLENMYITDEWALMVRQTPEKNTPFIMFQCMHRQWLARVKWNFEWKRVQYGYYIRTNILCINIFRRKYAAHKVESHPISVCCSSASWCTLHILLQDCNQIAHWSDTVYTARPVYKKVRKHCIEHHITWVYTQNN